jgi:hypothetical protein
MRRLCIVTPLLLAASVSGVQAGTEVGSAAAVRNDVKGTVVGPLRSGSPVHENETVSSGVDSSAQLLLRDKTSLTLGPTSQVTIDKFVYDPRRNSGEAAVNLVKGALRFVSGSQTPEQYSVHTPLASMGVRGTVAETFVSEQGFEVFLLVEGEIDVCVARTCRSVSTPGHFVVVAPDGAISQPAPWSGPMLDLKASADYLETYISSLLERGNDVLPRYRDLNDALKRNCFGANCRPVKPVDHCDEGDDEGEPSN